MEIIKIHSYLVNAEKGLNTAIAIKGTEIDNSGNMYPMLGKIFNEAPQECEFDIAFLPDDEGKQINESRNLILTYKDSGRYIDGEKIAARLQLNTTQKSKLGLFFLLLGKQGKKRRLVLSRFPADTGFLAEEQAKSLSVSYVERIFMKNAKAYKCACYEGTSDNDFWTGKAIDKQINSDLAIANYWIKDFLKSDFATTAERGTHKLAAALRNAINNKANPLEVRDEISSAIKLSKRLNGQVISPDTFASRMNLSDEAIEAFKKEIKHTLYDKTFRFNTEEFTKLIAFRTLELDNGAIISGEAIKFDQIYKMEQALKGKLTFSTTGKVIDERVKKRK